MNSSTFATDISVFNSLLSSSMNISQVRLSHTEEFDWILSMTFVVTLNTLTLWMLVSLIHYGVKTKLWKKKQKNKHALNSGKIYTCVVVLTCLCLLYFISSLVALNIGYNENEDKICKIISIVSFTLYLLIYTGVSLFLWLRQRVFYANQFLNGNYNRIIKMLSYVSIFVIVGNNLILLVIFFGITISPFTSSSNGCLLRGMRFPALGNLYDAYWILAACCIFFYYCVLFGLLSYALLSIKPVSTNKASNINRCTVNTQSENVMPLKTHFNIQRFNFLKIKSQCLNDKTCNNQNSLQQKILALKRTFLFAVLSLASLIVSEIVVQYYANPNDQVRISLVILNVDAFLQLLFVIFSFTTYKKMIASPMIKHLA